LTQRSVARNVVGPVFRRYDGPEPRYPASLSMPALNGRADFGWNRLEGYQHSSVGVKPKGHPFKQTSLVPGPGGWPLLHSFGQGMQENLWPLPTAVARALHIIRAISRTHLQLLESTEAQWEPQPTIRVGFVHPLAVGKPYHDAKTGVNPLLDCRDYHCPYGLRRI